jgi:hypothetical protein
MYDYRLNLFLFPSTNILEASVRDGIMTSHPGITFSYILYSNKTILVFENLI